MTTRAIQAAGATIEKDAKRAAYDALIFAAHAVGHGNSRSDASASDNETLVLEGVRRQYQRQSEVLRDIFGNPFRPVTFDSAWRTADALGLARGIYDDRAFDRLPILADALEDSGCDSADILDHCRTPGSHARGCWVVDLILGLS